MRELSLFSGAGGGLLASKYLLGWETIGYVEYEEYCQKVLKQRIADGLLDAAPIFGDIRAFISEGYAEQYRGMVDVITGGFPCQDISVIGTREGLQGKRSGLWKEFAECIRIIRPKFVFVENTPTLTSSGLGTILRDLAEAGYDAQWCVLGADALGCEHHRSRFWLVAFSQEVSRIQADKENVPVGKKGQAWEKSLRGHRKHEAEPYWFLHESYFTRGINDVADRVDRSKAIGNGQVPQCMARAWELLTEDLHD